jgi:hypothetical protein
MSWRTTSFYAGAAWGLDAFFALVVSAPVIAALRAEWPHLGADALVAPGGLEFLETLAQRGPVLSAAALVFVLLTLARWAAGVLVDVAHARALGSKHTSSSLALRMLAVRVLGAIPTGVLLAAALSPAYAMRETPLASLTTQGNVVLVIVLALPSLALALTSMGVERVVRAVVARDEVGVGRAWLVAVDGLSRGGLASLRVSAIAVVASLGLGALATVAAQVGYGVGIVLSQLLLFAGSSLRARAFAFAFRTRP